VKLAFSIAVHVDPDVLLVDEVLAVGDEAFARKCLSKIAEFQQQGKTILFVTHSLDLVEQLCTRGVVVDHGRVQYDGDPAFAVGTLRRILGTDRPVGEPPPPVPRGAYVHAAVPSLTKGGPRADEFVAGTPLHLRVDVEVIDAEDVFAGDVIVVAVGSGDYPIFAVRTPKGGGLPAVPGRYDVDFTVDAAPALNGSFILAVQVEDSDTGYPLAVARFDTILRCSSGDLPGILTVSSTSTVTPQP
jgi:ABC-2 type transport system ATP-binding protein